MAMNWRVINDVLSPYGVAVETEQIAQYVSRSPEDQMHLINNNYNLDLQYSSFAPSVTEAKEKHSTEPNIKEGAIDLLKLLEQGCIPRAVATSTARHIAE